MRHDLVSDLHWTQKKHLHITLYFFGDVAAKSIPSMREKLRQLAFSTAAFTLQFEKVLFAPPHRPPRMIWAEFAANPEYAKLAARVYEAVKEFLDPLSAQESARKAVPHITLARFKKPSVAKSLKLETIQPAVLNATSCDLISSELTPKGPVYTVLEHYAFS